MAPLSYPGRLSVGVSAKILLEELIRRRQTLMVLEPQSVGEDIVLTVTPRGIGFHESETLHE